MKQVRYTGFRATGFYLLDLNFVPIPYFRFSSKYLVPLLYAVLPATRFQRMQSGSGPVSNWTVDGIETKLMVPLFKKRYGLASDAVEEYVHHLNHEFFKRKTQGDVIRQPVNIVDVSAEGDPFTLANPFEVYDHLVLGRVGVDMSRHAPTKTMTREILRMWQSYGDEFKEAWHTWPREETWPLPETWPFALEMNRDRDDSKRSGDVSPPLMREMFFRSVVSPKWVDVAGDV